MKVYVVHRVDMHDGELANMFIVGVSPLYEDAMLILSNDFMSECELNDIDPHDNQDSWIDHDFATLNCEHMLIHWETQRKELNDV